MRARGLQSGECIARRPSLDFERHDRAARPTACAYERCSGLHVYSQVTFELRALAFDDVDPHTFVGGKHGDSKFSRRCI